MAGAAHVLNSADLLQQLQASWAAGASAAWAAAGAKAMETPSPQAVAEEPVAVRLSPASEPMVRQTPGLAPLVLTPTSFHYRSDS